MAQIHADMYTKKIDLQNQFNKDDRVRQMSSIKSMRIDLETSIKRRKGTIPRILFVCSLLLRVAIVDANQLTN